MTPAWASIVLAALGLISGWIGALARAHTARLNKIDDRLSAVEARTCPADDPPPDVNEPGG